MSFADAAFELLKESGESRHYRWLAEESLKRGLIETSGKTPEATMYTSIFEEIKKAVPGKRPSRFVKTGRGMFGLAEWQVETPDKPAKKVETGQRYFVFIVNDAQGVHGRMPAREIYEQLMQISAWGIGERTPCRKDLCKGSRVVFYQAGKGGQRFIGTATVASELRSMSTDRAAERRTVGIEPAKYDLDLADIDIWEETKPVVDMVQRLEFISNKDHYGIHFQGGVKHIDEADYYTIIEFKPPKGMAKLESRTGAAYSHSLLQGILVEVGNMLGYDTYSADQSPAYRDTTVGELATLDALPDFTSKRILNTARQIDVIWIEDEFPVCCFEIEHSTDVTKGLLRMHQLIRFQAQFFIIAPEGTRRKFETEISKSPFYQSQERYYFRSYEEVESLYKLTRQFVTRRDEFLNE
jgi:predicted RNA-binding protein